MANFTHKPVLLEQCLAALDVRPDGSYIDGTAGGGGHSQAIAGMLTTGRLLCIDKDPDALCAVRERLGDCPQVIIAEGDFSDIDKIAGANGLDKPDGILLDIGVSSHQLDTPERGFSFHTEAPLDMRMSQEGPGAYELVNSYAQDALAKIFFEYGDERYARNIARKIALRRSEKPIETTLELANIIISALPPSARRAEGHPAQRSFQAIRIEVNNELGALETGIDAAFEILAPGGRLAVISFHSLEDRIVKLRFAGFAKGCTCPPDFPVCVCGKAPRGRLISKKPITAGEAELSENSRSRSAKLRVIEKIS